jgi:hypothetical protein
MKTLSVISQILLSSLLFAVLSIGGCNCWKKTTVVSFEAQPETICAGNEVILSWQTKFGTTTTISADPETTPAIGIVDNEGSASVQIEENTIFTIHVSGNWGEDTKTKKVFVVPEGGTDFTLAAAPKCVSGQISRSAVATPEDWSSDLTVTTVINTSGQSIRVSHGNTAVNLGTNDETVAFNGQQLVGDWGLMKIGENGQPIIENCGGGTGGTTHSADENTDHGTAPGSLSIKVHVICPAKPK